MMEIPQTMDSEAQEVMLANEVPSDPPPLEDFGGPAPVSDEPEAAAERLEAVYDVPVKVQVVLGRSRIAIGALMQLKAGAIVELDRRVGEPVDAPWGHRSVRLAAPDGTQLTLFTPIED